MSEIRPGTVLPADRQPITLRTADGLSLVGELALPAGRPPAATLICLHPLPTQGGMMDSHVLRKAAFRLPALADLAVLRFNTRGTMSEQGTSEGEFGDGETEARAANGLGARGIGTVEAFKDVLNILLGDTDTRVAHNKMGAFVAHLDGERDAAASVGIDERVIDQTYDHLNQARSVTYHRRGFQILGTQRQMTFGGQRLHAFHDISSQQINAHRFEVKLDLLLIGARQGEQIIDQVAEAFRLRVDFAQYQ